MSDLWSPPVPRLLCIRARQARAPDATPLRSKHAPPPAPSPTHTTCRAHLFIPTRQTHLPTLNPESPLGPPHLALVPSTRRMLCHPGPAGGWVSTGRARAQRSEKRHSGACGRAGVVEVCEVEPEDAGLAGGWFGGIVVS